MKSAATLIIDAFPETSGDARAQRQSIITGKLEHAAMGFRLSAGELQGAFGKANASFSELGVALAGFPELD